jgi:hypothetical protein
MNGDTAMALDDYPTQLLGWDTGFMPDLLQALGQLAVVTAGIEEALHQIYWKHGGLNKHSGPIVTDNLNPKRLSEDILKFARLDPAKANVVADLEVLLAEFEALNTKRNQCLHWIWEKVEAEQPDGTPIFGILNYKPPASYRVKRPAYKKKGAESQPYSAEDIKTLCEKCSWVARRLHAHALDEGELRRLRRDGAMSMDGETPFSTMADIFWPAPWLDKPLPQAKKPSDRPDGQK